METKLTLKLDKTVIEKAKQYAASQNRSLSKIIEAYLQTLTNKAKTIKKETEIPISSFVKSMSTGIQIPPDLDSKKEYMDHLLEKYK